MIGLMRRESMDLRVDLRDYLRMSGRGPVPSYIPLSYCRHHKIQKYKAMRVYGQLRRWSRLLRTFAFRHPGLDLRFRPPVEAGPYGPPMSIPPVTNLVLHVLDSDGTSSDEGFNVGEALSTPDHGYSRKDPEFGGATGYSVSAESEDEMHEVELIVDM
ncbi:hypothetical protein PENSPDRAFT_667021 [Peniophora sp. CONT]|nr:hypothetical protein PENSPDRAFT_667021 [Peniophora sp. CONT]